MVSVEVPFRNTRLVSAHHRWFAEVPNPSDRLKFVYYYQCRSTLEHAGFQRELKFTKLLDISRDEDAIMAAFSKTSRYEVRRAGKEGLQFSTVDDMSVFQNFYNEFADAKDLGHINPVVLDRYWPVMRVTQIARDDEVFVMHGYILDRENSRTNLNWSASQFRGMDDKDRRRLYGRANRRLYFEDMRWFKGEGFTCYDFGGYAKDTTDKSLAAVNEFKDSFGGDLVEESNYISQALRTLRGLKKLVGRG